MNIDLSVYGISPAAQLIPINQGLINKTWKIIDGERSFILQQINTNVFKNPRDIAFNISCIAQWLKQHYPEYLFVSPVKTNSSEELLVSNNSFFRLFPFIEGSHTIDRAESPDQAYQAARQFGKFTAVLNGFDCEQLKITIPDFHNLELRFMQFENALKNGNPERINETKELAKELNDHADILKTYQAIRNDPDFKLRVTHHDTKISNVLFDKKNKGICVIDPDTIMPGYFISDLGDMMRTYLCPVTEEEKDLDKIIARPDFYKAIINGYEEEMKDALTNTEKNYFLYSGVFMTYMQAIRFLTDYLNNDQYYSIHYKEQNFNRAKNQARLLKRLWELS